MIVGQCSELAYDVVFCWIATGWNREDYSLERVHLDVLSMNRSNDVFLGIPMKTASGTAAKAAAVVL